MMRLSFYVRVLFLHMIIFELRLETADSKIIQGELNTTETWSFLTRFCFLSRHGKFAFEVEYPKSYKTQKILLYYDEKDHWPAVYGTNKSCIQKETVLSSDKGQIIFLDETVLYSGCFARNVGDSELWLQCEHERKFLSARERWWFIVVSNCNSEKGLYLRYRFTMKNDEENPWFMHFSADEFYILQTDIGFLVFYVVLLFASILEANALRSRHLLHRTYILYITSVAHECVGLAFLCANYTLYAQQGTVSPGIKLAGKGMEAISTLLFLMLLILIAKGYTVTRGRLRQMTIMKIVAFLAVYVIIYSALFLYEQKFFDPGRVLYLYESPAGYGLIGLRLIGWTWFVYATIFTMIHYPEKSNFYTRLFLLYSLWFLSTPVVILISTFIVPKWMREKLVNGVELFICLKAHIIFFILTRPSKANKNFPYHVRTTQIGVMQQDLTGSGDNSIDRFAHHPYAVTTTNHVPTAPDYSALFGVQNNPAANSVEMRTSQRISRPTQPSNHAQAEMRRY